MRKRFAIGLTALSGLSVLAPAAHAAVATIGLNQVDRSAAASANGGLGTFDLTAGGNALDWFKAGGGTAVLVGAEKNSTTALALTSPGIAGYTIYGDDGYKLTWSGGDPTKPAGDTGIASNINTYKGVRANFNLNANDIGYRTTFTAPDAGDYTVTLYSAATNAPLVDLTVTDGVSGSVLANTTIAADSNTTAAVDELTWTVAITGATAGQTFALDLFHVDNTTNTILAMTGASVVAVPEPASFAVLAGLGGLTLLRRRRA